MSTKYLQLLGSDFTNHEHENLNLYDTVNGTETIDINAAEPQCPLEVTLTSETYTDFSNITVTLTNGENGQSIVSGADGVVAGLSSEPEFKLVLSSTEADFDPTLVTITCKYKLDVGHVLHDYVLHVDMDGDGDGDDINNDIIIDDTLSITGAAADAKAVGDAINNLTASDVNAVPVTRTINGKQLNKDIVLTPEDIGVVTETDTTFTIEGMAADAKAVGDAINSFEGVINSLDSNKVPITRTINGKQLNEDIILTAEDIGVITNIETDTTFTTEGMAADAKITGDRFSNIESQLADILYEPISITSFTNNVGTVEIGSTVTNITLSWKINKTPVVLTLDDAAIDTSLTSISSSNMSLTTDKTWTLKATDDRDAVSLKTTKITFLNGVYYGVVDSDVTINNGVIAGLTKKLQSGKSITFTATANDNQKIVYALPTSYGTPTFNVGGFDGGFNLYSTFEFENSSGYTEPYCVWISDNVGLGETTVKVN